jgi:hypothetical protein
MLSICLVCNAPFHLLFTTLWNTSYTKKIELFYYPQSTPWCYVKNLKTCYTLHMYDLHESINLRHEIEHWWLFILETNCWHPLCFYGFINITYLAHVNILALFMFIPHMTNSTYLLTLTIPNHYLCPHYNKKCPCTPSDFTGFWMGTNKEVVNSLV